jgi:hypothetical protein
VPTFRRPVQVRTIEVAVTYAQDDERVSGVREKRFFCAGRFVLLRLTNTSAECQGTNQMSSYAYNGGNFSVTVTFKAFTSYESDGSARGDLGNPGWVIVSNVDTGKLASFPYLQSV